jgi:myo-inositol 2-dehydrogenase / D-chiro-inositol 1-dehydrogenase
LDVANWFKNAYPVRAHGMGGRQVRTGKEYGEIFDHHAVEFEYADGSRCFSQCRHIRGCLTDVSEHAIGSKGNCDLQSNRIYRLTGPKEWRFNMEGQRNPYQQEHDALFDAIRNNKPHNEAERGAKSTMTSILGRMATYSGVAVNWNDALNSEISIMPKEYRWDAQPPTLPDEKGFYPIPMPGSSKVV